MYTSLHDAEQSAGRRLGVVRSTAASGPAQRQFHRFARFAFGRRIGRALIEHHRDVRAQVALHLHRDLRTEEYFAPVDRRTKAHALLAQLAPAREAEDLEPARIGEDRAVPIHEAMQAGMRADYRGTRSQHEMKCVAQDDLCADADELLGCHRLHGPVRAHRHECRSVNDAALEFEAPAPRAIGRCEQFELHVASAAGVRNIASP